MKSKIRIGQIIICFFILSLKVENITPELPTKDPIFIEEISNYNYIQTLISRKTSNRELYYYSPKVNTGKPV